MSGWESGRRRGTSARRTRRCRDRRKSSVRFEQDALPLAESEHLLVGLSRVSVVFDLVDGGLDTGDVEQFLELGDVVAAEGKGVSECEEVSRRRGER